MAATFLLSRPRGAFTCARANAAGDIVGKDIHLKRLCDSFAVIFPLEDKSLNDRQAILAQVEIEAGKHLEQKLDKDMMLVLLAYYDHEKKSIVVERQCFPVPMQRATVNRVVISNGGPRSNHVAKDSAWITERKPFEELKKAHQADELVLAGRDSDGQVILLEGLITNFFVLTNDNVVLTAPASLVLQGSMRSLAINACRAEGLTVQEEAPKWEMRREWKAAFLTSVTKPCNFIRSLTGCAEDASISSDEFLGLTDPIITRICDKVDSML